VTLDRQTIEKRDFPIARRGYDPAAVDAHLARIADDLDALRREMDRAATGGVAGSASSHVQSIVDAAESTAEQLLREASAEAVEVRERAASDAQRARQEALEESREHIGKVGESTTRMAQRVESMDSEVASMVESMRTGVNRLVADLALLEGNIADLHEQHGGIGPVATSVTSDRDLTGVSNPFFAGSPPSDDEPAASIDLAVESDPLETVDEPLETDLEPETAGTDANGDAGPERDQEASARLVALDLALGGSEREDIRKELEEHFTLPDVESLLDDVFASLEG
jgi:DivIVA domain-containing protein